ncbi:restriction endonuclease subunit S [Tistlia consotensis]
MSTTLEAMARALFKAWFVDFEPVRAKSEGRDPGLPPHLTDLFPARLVETDHGEVPEGWNVSRIGNEVRVVGGSTPSTRNPAFWDGEINWATPKDLSSLEGPALLETSRRITSAGLAKIGSGLLPVGTVLLSSRAPIGYLAIAEIPVSVNQGFVAMVCEGRLSNVFAWLWTQANMEAILQNANGSTFQEISKSNFRPLPVIVPTDDVLEAFDGPVQSLHSRIVSCERETRTLAALRDTLLPQLISGDLRVKDAETFLDRVL